MRALQLMTPMDPDSYVRNYVPNQASVLPVVAGTTTATQSTGIDMNSMMNLMITMMIVVMMMKMMTGAFKSAV